METQQRIPLCVFELHVSLSTILNNIYSTETGKFVASSNAILVLFSKM